MALKLNNPGTLVLFNPGDVLSGGDVTIPVITVLGDPAPQVLRNSVYVDAGAVAWDDIDGDITGNIVTNNAVDTAVLGLYPVTYNVQDSSLNAAAEATRTVMVVESLIVDINDPYFVKDGSSNAVQQLVDLEYALIAEADVAWIPVTTENTGELAIEANDFVEGDSVLMVSRGVGGDVRVGVVRLVVKPAAT